MYLSLPVCSVSLLKFGISPNSNVGVLRGKVWLKKSNQSSFRYYLYIFRSNSNIQIQAEHTIVEQLQLKTIS